MGAGVKVVTGTDEGGWEHGNNAHEISMLVEAGMAPMRAIVAATGHAALCLGLEAEIGRVANGLQADLILVDGNPLEDVTRLEYGESVRFVMKGGIVHLDRREVGHGAST